MSETPDGNQAELPKYKYKCLEEIHALKIKSVEAQDGKILLTPEDTAFAPFPVDTDFFAHYNPKAGGYYVVGTDGYKRFMSASAFEETYTKL